MGSALRPCAAPLPSATGGEISWGHSKKAQMAFHTWPPGTPTLLQDLCLGGILRGPCYSFAVVLIRGWSGWAAADSAALALSDAGADPCLQRTVQASWRPCCGTPVSAGLLSLARTLALPCERHPLPWSGELGSRGGLDGLSSCPSKPHAGLSYDR